jgi:hypothetical protein
VAKYAGHGEAEAHRTPKQYRRARRLSEKAGWRWVSARSQHINVFDPRGEHVCCISQTAFDGKLTRVVLGKLRRAGCPGA